MNPIIVLVTASSPEEARVIAKGVLEARVAACANIVPGIESHYWWQGKLETAAECLLVIKSSREQFDALAILVKQLHSYECPEIVALAPAAVDARYLQWWDGELGAGQSS